MTSSSGAIYSSEFSVRGDIGNLYLRSRMSLLPILPKIIAKHLLQIV